MQALFSHGFDAARVAVPVDTAIENLNRLLTALQRGGENVVFAAPVAFGLAHDLKPALDLVTDQITCLEAEIGSRQIDRRSLQQVLDNLKRAQRRFKVCRSRLQSIATLFKQTAKRRERCCMNSVIDQVHEWLTPDLADDDVHFEFSSAHRVHNDLMHADEVQLLQVVYNLVANALRALRGIPKQNRRIKVRTFQPEDPRLIGISVTDTAGALLPEVQARMYEPFFSAYPQGTGLGLWIIKEILDRLGVTPVVSVHPGVSTTFSIDLPREW